MERRLSVDVRFTGTAVVNWIRAGFGKPPVETGNAPQSPNIREK